MKAFDGTVAWETHLPVFNPPKIVEEPGVSVVSDAVKRGEPIILGGYSEPGANYGMLKQDAPLEASQRSGLCCSSLSSLAVSNCLHCPCNTHVCLLHRSIQVRKCFLGCVLDFSLLLQRWFNQLGGMGGPSVAKAPDYMDGRCCEQRRRSEDVPVIFDGDAWSDGCPDTDVTIGIVAILEVAARSARRHSRSIRRSKAQTNE